MVHSGGGMKSVQCAWSGWVIRVCIALYACRENLLPSVTRWQNRKKVKLLLDNLIVCIRVLLKFVIVT